MAPNHKLTKVIQGRTITSTQTNGTEMKIGFGDGSVMTVQIAPGGSAPAATGGTIKSVRQQDTHLALDLTDGTTLALETAEATSSVLLRDKNNTLEYAD